MARGTQLSTRYEDWELGQDQDLRILGALHPEKNPCSQMVGEISFKFNQRTLGVNQCVFLNEYNYIYTLKIPRNSKLTIILTCFFP